MMRESCVTFLSFVLFGGWKTTQGRSSRGSGPISRSWISTLSLWETDPGKLLEGKILLTVVNGMVVFDGGLDQGT